MARQTGLQTSCSSNWLPCAQHLPDKLSIVLKSQDFKTVDELCAYLPAKGG